MRGSKGRNVAIGLKLKRENELALRIAARRNKLLGIWAAAHMGLKGEDAALYAMSTVRTGADDNDEALCRKVCSDLVARGFPIVDRDVRQQLRTCSAEARAECTRGTGCDE